MKKESLPRTWLEKGLFGNQLHMWCDICDREFVVKVGGLGSALTSIAGSIISSKLGVGSRITDAVGRHMLSKEAMSTVKKTLHQCPQCGRWVCDSDWNDDQNKCKICTGEYSGSPASPALFEEEVKKAAAAIAEAEATFAKAAATTIATAAKVAMEANMIICPHCGNQTLVGKFCASCGKPLVIDCPNCGATLPVTVKFCPNCGAKIG